MVCAIDPRDPFHRQAKLRSPPARPLKLCVAAGPAPPSSEVAAFGDEPWQQGAGMPYKRAAPCRPFAAVPSQTAAWRGVGWRAPCCRGYSFDGDRDGIDFLDEFGAERFDQGCRSGAGCEHSNSRLRHVRERSLHGRQLRLHGGGLSRFVTLVARPQDLLVLESIATVFTVVDPTSTPSTSSSISDEAARPAD
jgi:hypothetical protein